MTRIGMLGGIDPESTGKFYLKLIILLGCTEISLMLENSDLPKINTMLENTIRRLSL
ncbi:MAG: hypothetical protein J4473_03770 [Candidatus Aenigmarchaeota archaeon]|nr:hypothetical protein [Candidatus Aenigmarchaeota archaeon]